MARNQPSILAALIAAQDDLSRSEAQSAELMARAWASVGAGISQTGMIIAQGMRDREAKAERWRERSEDLAQRKAEREEDLAQRKAERKEDRVSEEVRQFRQGIVALTQDFDPDKRSEIFAELMQLTREIKDPEAINQAFNDLKSSIEEAGKTMAGRKDELQALRNAIDIFQVIGPMWQYSAISQDPRVAGALVDITRGIAADENLPANFRTAFSMLSEISGQQQSSAAQGAFENNESGVPDANLPPGVSGAAGQPGSPDPLDSAILQGLSQPSSADRLLARPPDYVPTEIIDDEAERRRRARNQEAERSRRARNPAVLPKDNR